MNCTILIGVLKYIESSIALDNDGNKAIAIKEVVQVDSKPPASLIGKTAEETAISLFETDADGTPCVRVVMSAKSSADIGCDPFLTGDKAFMNCIGTGADGLPVLRLTSTA